MKPFAILILAGSFTVVLGERETPKSDLTHARVTSA